MEIEKKFISPKEKKEDVERAIREISEEGIYAAEFGTEELQTDIYFDTQDMELWKNDYTLRIRKKGEKIYLTCKHPIQSRSNGIGGQLEREENEEVVRTEDLEDLEDNQKIVVRLLKGVSNSFEIIGELQEKIKVRNHRMKAVIERKSDGNKSLPEKYEVAIDCVE